MFSFEKRITYADCTLGNHVYYARYLDFLEAARGELFRSVEQPLQYWQDRGVIFPVYEVNLRYREAARYDDVIRIDVWLARLRKAFADFAYRVRKECGSLVVEAQTRHVCTSLEERPRTLPAQLVEALAGHLKS